MRILFLLLVLILVLCQTVTADNFGSWKKLARPEGLPEEKGPSGVPMGGIGCGYIELSPEGFLHRNCMNNIHESYIEDVRGTFFAVREKIGSNVSAVRLQKDNETVFGMKGVDDIDYTGMFPAADSIYKSDKLKTRINMTAYSFLVPHSIKNSSLPAVCFDFQLTNTENKPAEIDLLFSYADVICRGIKDTDRYYEEGFRMDGNSGFWHFMTPPETSVSNIKIKNWSGTETFAKAEVIPSKLTMQNYNTHIARITDGEAEGFSYMLSDNKAMDEFVKTGHAGAAKREYQAEPANKPAAADAVIRHIPLKAGETKKVRFMLCWYADAFAENISSKHHKGMSYNKYYHNYFNNISELCSYVIDNREKLLEDTLSWHLPILKSSFPGWLKFKIINSGYTVYTNGVLNRDGDYTSLEGGMGGLGGTMDQKLSSNPFIYKLLTQLDKNENQQFANYPEKGGEISHFDVHYYDGINTHIKKEDGGIGANSDMAAAAGTQGSMVDNTGTWLLQLIKTYKQTGDKTAIIKNYGLIKSAMAFMEARHNSLDFPDYNTTYDDFPHPKGFVYTAVLYPVMLDAARQAAEIMGDKEYAEKYSSMREKALAGADKLYINEGGYYAYGYDFGKNEPVKNEIHTGSLAGEFINRYLGQGNSLPYEKTKSALKYILSTAIQNAPGYYSPKSYDLSDGRFMDMQGSACWPFYQDSYVAMTALQMGMAADGLTLLEATQKVHEERGYLWTQSLWTPNYLTYMTAPVSWFISDVLAGAAIDVNEKVLTLGPTEMGNYTEIPLYFPDFWAELYINYDKKAANLKITKSFKEHTFDTLRIMTPGHAASEAEDIKLPSEFKAEKGAMLALTPYFDKLTNALREPLLLAPAAPYKGFEAEPVPNGTGVKREIFEKGVSVGVEAVKEINEEIKAEKAVYSGFLKPRYAQEYTLYCTCDGSVNLTINGEEIINETKKGKQTYEGKYIFSERKKYPFVLTAENCSSVKLEWWSTTNTLEVIPQKRSYPPYEIEMALPASDAVKINGSVRVEDDHLGFIENGNNVIMPEITVPAGKYTLNAECASQTEGGILTVKIGDKELGKTEIKGNNSWGNFINYSFSFETDKEISGPIKLEFTGNKTGYLYNIRNISINKG